MALVATGFAIYYYCHIPLENHPELWLGFGWKLTS